MSYVVVWANYEKVSTSTAIYINYHIPERTRFLSKQVLPVIKILILCLMIEVVNYYTVMSEVSLFIFFVGKCCTCRIVIRQMVYCCFSVNGCIYRFGQWFKLKSADAFFGTCVFPCRDLTKDCFHLYVSVTVRMCFYIAFSECDTLIISMWSSQCIRSRKFEDKGRISMFFPVIISFNAFDYGTVTISFNFNGLISFA